MTNLNLALVFKLKGMKLFYIFILYISISGNHLNAQVTSGFIDSLAESCLKSFNVAGAAIAVVQDGKVIHSKGYGYKNIQSKEPVNDHTNFAIASNTKAFTAAALAILVEEGKLKWEDNVVTYIPEFKMYNDYVTKNFNIKDLLTHRSGMGLGVGDLMVFPDGTDFTIKDIATSFQHFKPVSAFRTQYDYDNMLYLVAGEVIARISRKKWHEFVHEKIIIPLGMTHTFCDEIQGFKDENIALPHGIADGQLKALPHFHHTANGAAGGILSNVHDLSKWMITQLQRGKYGDDKSKTIFSENSHRDMWQIHTPIPASRNKRYNSHFSGYGLGWFLSDKGGIMVAEHTGGLPGMLSKTLLLPDLNAGIVVLTNTEPGGAAMFNTIAQSVLDNYLKLDHFDWLSFYASQMKSMLNTGDSVTTAVWQKVASSKHLKPNPNTYAGMYADKWFGKIEVYQQDGKLYIRALRSPKLNGELQHVENDTFAVKWEYQDMNADVLVTFLKDKKGLADRMKIKGISPNIDFSFDFHDLDPVRVGK